MLHDETEYPEPFAFLPERWIMKDGQKQPRDPTKIAFGFGRRYVLIYPIGYMPPNYYMTVYVPARTWQKTP